MEKGRLRVLDAHKLPKKILQVLKEILPEYELEQYSKNPDYKESFANRVDSLYNAFIFILQAYPPDTKYTAMETQTLKDYASDCRNIMCNLKKDTFDELQQELGQFTGRLVAVLAEFWQWPEDVNKIAAATELLNDAEAYAMMGRGRQDIATVVPIVIDTKMHYVVQIDKALPSYSDSTIKEVNELKNLNYPKSPAWYRKLPEFAQSYFCHLDLKDVSLQNIQQDLNSLLDYLKLRRKQFSNFDQELSQIKEEKKNLPAWFKELKSQHSEMIKALLYSHATSDLESLLQQFAENIKTTIKEEWFDQVHLIVKLPQWYWTLPETHQIFLSHVLKTTVSPEQALFFIVSKYVRLQVISNYNQHDVLLITPDNKVELLVSSFRFGNMGSRDIKNKMVKNGHAEANFKKIMFDINPEKNKSVIFNTLISPLPYLENAPNFLVNFVSKHLPDQELYHRVRKVVENSEYSDLVLNPNHSLNYAKYLNPTSKDNLDSQKLITSAQEYLKKHKDTSLEVLLDDYIKLLDSGLGSATVFDKCRELFLSSLETLLFLGMKEKNTVSASCCVSGKDRTAIDLIHRLAMILYNKKYGTWPKYDDLDINKENRKKFVDILVSLYCSYHHHEVAGQNAPGCKGLKTPTMYMPSDVCEAIKKYQGNNDALTNDDGLASNNEVKAIMKRVEYPEKNDYLISSHLLARQLGTELCDSLYHSLYWLINEVEQFTSIPTFTFFGGKGNTPGGIDKIHTLMGESWPSDTNPLLRNVLRMESIFFIILDRRVEDKTRTEATNSVYDGVRRLLNRLNPNVKLKTPLDRNITLSDAASNLAAEWSKFFDDAKIKNQTLLLEAKSDPEIRKEYFSNGTRSKSPGIVEIISHKVGNIF